MISGGGAPTPDKKKKRVKFSLAFLLDLGYNRMGLVHAVFPFPSVTTARTKVSFSTGL
jgi:hypothetical protein